MAKTIIPQTTITDPHFAELLEEYRMTASLIKDEQNHLDEIYREIKSYAGVDENTEFQGHKHLVSGNILVDLTYSLNPKIDKDRAIKECTLNGYNPLDLFNVDLNYAKSKLKDMDEGMKDVVEAVTTYSRAKTKIEFKLI